MIIFLSLLTPDSLIPLLCELYALLCSTSIPISEAHLSKTGLKQGPESQRMVWGRPKLRKNSSRHLRTEVKVLSRNRKHLIYALLLSVMAKKDLDPISKGSQPMLSMGSRLVISLCSMLNLLTWFSVCRTWHSSHLSDHLLHCSFIVGQ